MIDVSIIIVSYNTKEYLKKCIDSMIESIGERLTYEIIVVDNKSNDGTAEELSKQKERFKNLTTIENSKNVGFSKANNIGVKKAKGRYILFLNPDTVVYKETIYHMVKFMDENKKAGAATCFVKLPNGELDEAAHRGFPTPWNAFSYFSGLGRIFPNSRLFSGYTLGWMSLTRVHEIDSCAGVFMIVRREIGEEVDWWDEDYFWYGEDLDFCFRLKKKGWKIYFVPEVSILHYKGVSGGIKKISSKITTADNKTKNLATKARFEAMRIFYNKHYKKNYPPFLNWFIFKVISFKEFVASRSI
jgi:GT2 family glycosyltransferase